MRIAIVIVALALLFNFFAYYLLYIRSKENETLVEEVGLSGNQLNLVQRISEETILLLNSNLKESESFSIRQNLENSIQQLDKQNKSLFQKITRADTADLHSHATIAHLLYQARPAIDHIKQISREVSAADKSFLAANSSIYLRELRRYEAEAVPLLEQITRAYTGVMNETLGQSATINTGKFISLLVALGCLGLLVIEPLMKSNKRNLSQLHLAKTELLQEKKYLSSILNSQTNYVTRIDRNGNFTYVNPEFLKTFGYTHDDLINHTFHTIIYPKDILRCQQVADDCWEHPGTIQKLLIKKPIKRSRRFLWTEWEFIALINDNGQVTEIQGIGVDVTEKMQSQQSREEAIQALSYALSYAHMGSWKLNFTTMELYMSEELKNVKGLPKGYPDIISMEEYIHSFVVPEDAAIVINEIKKAVDNKYDSTYEYSFSYRIVTGDGRKRYLFVKGKVLDEQYAFGITQDITAQKEAEQLLLNSEQQYRLLAEHSEDIITVHTAEADIQYVSPSVKTVLGYSPEEV
ncbi:MAG TPA: PAS domain-containing protein, partial [Chitinophagaceae bacterium]|nr:PAS domain-containing protein [Chitinophagaceae bacterium]